MFPICWMVAIFLPYCSRNPNDRRAAIGSGIMLAFYITVIVLAVAIPLSIMAREAVNPGLVCRYGEKGCSGYNYNG